MSLLTDKKINSLKPGQWATQSNARGAGQLQARGLQNKRIAYYFRYTGVNHKQIRIPLGSGLTLLEARRKADLLSRQLQDGHMPVQPLRSTRSARAEHHHTTQKATFGDLLQAYVADLKHRGCISAREVHNAFERHIHQTYPQYWAFPAAAIATGHILQIIRFIVDQGKLRAADKLRCHIRAAYAAAIRARSDGAALPVLSVLGVTTNPAKDIPPIRNSSQTKDRVLSLAELQAYWQHIKNLNTPAGALLRFHLLTGGQRIRQLARATHDDYDADSQTLTLKDPKGRRHQPRQHTIPILPQAHEAMGVMHGVGTAQYTPENTTNKSSQSNYIWSVTQGQYGACYSTASKALKQVIEQIRRREATNNSGGGSFLTDFTLGISEEP